MVSDRALELHRQALVVVGHDHTMIGTMARRERGERAVFANYHAPLAREGGVDVIGLVIGGDRPRPAKGGGHPWWDSLSLIDAVWQEAEQSCDTLVICLNCSDIDRAAAEGKVAVLMTMEGGRPVAEGPGAKSMVNLRTLYRLGLRGLQLLGQGWNPLVDAAEGAEVSEGLTSFGKAVVREMNRLGMVIDVAHISDDDPLFWDVIEASEDPVIDSHDCVRGANDVPHNLSDEGIKAIAEKGGVIGVHFMSQRVSAAVDQATVDDLVGHIDHIAALVGIDHVGLGPDLAELELVGLDPGSYYIEGVQSLAHLPRVTEVLVRRGYSDEEVRKVLGENFLRVYGHVMG
jgi:membrane dipeptidase